MPDDVTIAPGTRWVEIKTRAWVTVEAIAGHRGDLVEYRRDRSTGVSGRRQRVAVLDEHFLERFEPRD
jgi:hypothetical protein